MAAVRWGGEDDTAELLPELVSGRIEGVLGAAPPGATRGKLPVAAPEPETLGEGKQLAFCPLEREWGKAGSEGSPLLFFLNPLKLKILL